MTLRFFAGQCGGCIDLWRMLCQARMPNLLLRRSFEGLLAELGDRCSRHTKALGRHRVAQEFPQRCGIGLGAPLVVMPVILNREMRG